MLRKMRILVSMVLVLGIAGSAMAAWSNGTFTSDTSFPPLPAAPGGLVHQDVGATEVSTTGWGMYDGYPDGTSADLFDGLDTTGPGSVAWQWGWGSGGGQSTFDFDASYSIAGIYIDSTVTFLQGMQSGFTLELYSGGGLVWSSSEAVGNGDYGGFLTLDSPVTADRGRISVNGTGQDSSDGPYGPRGPRVYEMAYYTPEPATIALLGLGSLALLRRRRKSS